MNGMRTLRDLPLGALLALLATKAGRKVGQSSAMRWFEGAMGVGFFGLAGRLALARNI